MTKHIEKIITECCVCKQQKDDKGEYYSPSPEERKKQYDKDYKISHGMCPDCYIMWEKKQEAKE